LKPLIQSAKDTYFPGEPVNTSATKNGCDKKRSILRARATANLSSSYNSSIPKLAILSCTSFYFCKIFFTFCAVS
jgi:hypothetical protein